MSRIQCKSFHGFASISYDYFTGKANHNKWKEMPVDWLVTPLVNFIPVLCLRIFLKFVYKATECFFIIKTGPVVWQIVVAGGTNTPPPPPPLNTDEPLPVVADVRCRRCRKSRKIVGLFPVPGEVGNSRTVRELSKWTLWPLWWRFYEPQLISSSAAPCKVDAYMTRSNAVLCVPPMKSLGSYLASYKRSIKFLLACGFWQCYGTLPVGETNNLKNVNLFKLENWLLKPNLQSLVSELIRMDLIFMSHSNDIFIRLFALSLLCWLIT